MARTDTLGHFLTDVADAIRTKGGTSANIQASTFDTAIANLPSGGSVVESNDVNFYDYDGKILYSYTKEDFLQLQEMPSNPIHEGLTSMGWNWTLQDIKNYLADHSFADIGQVYEPTDGKTKIYVSLTKGTLNPTLSFSINGSATIDWGDNSTPDVVTGTDITTIIDTPHNYSQEGDYVISITSDSIYYVPEISGTYGSKFFWKGGTLDYSNFSYLYTINKLILSNNVSLKNGGFKYCGNLKAVILPNVVTTYTSSSHFQYCQSLKHITIPNTSGYVVSSNFASLCYSLQSVALSNTTSQLSGSIFQTDHNLKRISIPNSVTSLGAGMFQDAGLEEIEITNNVALIKGVNSTKFVKSIIINSDCYFSSNSLNNNSSLSEVIIKGNVSSIANNSLNNNYVCVKYDFTHCTSVPTLSSTGAFNGINANCKIIVPDDLYDSWIVANNWSTYSNYIVKASDYNEE